MNCNNKNNIASVKHPTEHEDSAKSRDVNSAFNELQQIACVFLGFCFHFSRSRVESFPLMKIKNYWQCFFHLPITPSIRPEWFLWWSENFVLLSLQFNRKKKKRIRRKMRCSWTIMFNVTAYITDAFSPPNDVINAARNYCAPLRRRFSWQSNLFKIVYVKVPSLNAYMSN